jgi:ketosteroid isomerase-like protein
MRRENNKAINEAQIRELLNSWATAIRARNSNGPTANYAPDVLMFDVVNPLQYTGPDAVRKRVEEWLSSFQDPLGY